MRRTVHVKGPDQPFLKNTLFHCFNIPDHIQVMTFMLRNGKRFYEEHINHYAIHYYTPNPRPSAVAFNL